MLDKTIRQFLNYCTTANFSAKSLKTLRCRLSEFKDFIHQKDIDSIPRISYSLLLEFVADYKNPSVHIKKARVWTLHQFCHFLTAHKIMDNNIALQIPYPKVGKTVPKYLTIEEFNQLLAHFAKNADTFTGLRNLLITMLLGFLGLRLSSILNLNIEDVNLESSLLWIRDKGGIIRALCLPQVLCTLLAPYLEMHTLNQSPLFLSKRHRRISERTMQDIFKKAMAELGLEKHLHAHLFRHTAATHLNKVAGGVITQYVLGHARRKSTELYTHLNPDKYAKYMKKHPYHNL